MNPDPNTAESKSPDESASSAGALPLVFEGVTYSYPRSESAAVQRLDLRVERGTCLGVLGPNGGGKTTLVKLALGLLKPTEGRVSVMGMTPSAARAQGLVGYVSQHRPGVTGFPMSVRQFVELSLTAKSPGWATVSDAQHRRVRWAMDVTGAVAFGERPIGALSGGQLQRAMIARAIAPEPALLLLDEPTVGIDVAGQAAFASMLETVVSQTGTGIVVVSHDLRAVVAGCDRVACLNQKLHAHVSSGGLTPRVLGEVFAHEVEGVLGEVHVEAHLASECAHEHGGHEHDASGTPGEGEQA